MTLSTSSGDQFGRTPLLRVRMSSSRLFISSIAARSHISSLFFSHGSIGAGSPRRSAHIIASIVASAVFVCGRCLLLSRIGRSLSRKPKRLAALRTYKLPRCDLKHRLIVGIAEIHGPHVKNTATGAAVSGRSTAPGRGTYMIAHHGHGPQGLYAAIYRKIPPSSPPFSASI